MVGNICSVKKDEHLRKMEKLINEGQSNSREIITYILSKVNNMVLKKTHQ